MAESARQTNLFSDDSTDFVLMVDALGQEESCEWDRTRIRDALIVEAGVSPTVAEAISVEVEEELLEHARQRVSTALIRELVNVKLFQRGLDAKLTDHRRIGLPLHDLERMLFHKNRENSVSGHNPESINHAIAEAVIKEYALSKVFSTEVADAHLKGDIHLHDLGMANRPYSICQNAAYAARCGLALPGGAYRATPAKHAEVLLAHLVKITMILQNSFAGAIAWDAVNIVFAPYLERLDDAQIRQLAQTMLFEFDRLASGRGAAVFTSFDLYFEVPRHIKDYPAIGAGGKFSGKNYSDYAAQSQKFLRAILEIYRQGCDGHPFLFPKAMLHITRESFETEGFDEILRLASAAASEKGSVQFVFDRDYVTAGECYRVDKTAMPSAQRSCALQNVTLNLPRAAYRAKDNRAALPEILSELLETAARAHIQKRDFLRQQLNLGFEGPLALLAGTNEEERFYIQDDAICLIGLLGLNEFVQTLTGHELHETAEAMQLGLDSVKLLFDKSEELSRKYNMRFELEQTPAESTALRFAKLDLRKFEEAARAVVKGDIKTGAVYYTNSTQFNVSAGIPLFEKILQEGKYHRLFAGAAANIYTGGTLPKPESVAELVKKAFFETDCAQLVFSPAFTVCTDCGYTARGFTEYCLNCEGENIDRLARIAGSYSYSSSWNKGKLAELKDRRIYKI